MAVAEASKPDKPERHHNGNGGKHDSGVDGKHPVNTSSSKAGKQAATPSAPTSNSWESAAEHSASMPTSNSWESAAEHSASTPTSNSWESAAVSHPTSAKAEKSKSGKTSGTIMSMSMSYDAKSHKISDSKADKGDEMATWSKPAPNEYNGVKMVVKIPESGNLFKPKSGKNPDTSSGGSWSSATTTAATATTTEPVEESVETTTTTATATAATEATLPAATTPQAIEKVPTVPDKRVDSSPDLPDEINSPTYSPTSPYTTVTMEHLLHSFRTKGWDADRLTLMLLDDEDRRRSLRKLEGFPVHELVFGGILYFKATAPMPSKEEENALVEESFSGDRLRYFVNLLKERGVDVASASWGHLPTISSEPSGGSGGKLAVVLGSVLGSIGLIVAAVFLVRLYNKRTRRIQDGDKPSSLVFRIKDEVESMQDERPDGSTDIPSEIEDNAAASRYSYYSKQPLLADPVSPLDSPGVSTSTRYVSVFTVKKDCGGKTLEEVDLRSLAVAYLSRLFKKVPDTNLLPYDKESELPAIKNIRNIPDDLQELLKYVGNPRIDESTGKVLFNLRCESDVPMSKMKNLSSSRLPKEMNRSPGSEDNNAASGFEDVTL